MIHLTEMVFKTRGTRQKDSLKLFKTVFYKNTPRYLVT